MCSVVGASPREAINLIKFAENLTESRLMIIFVTFFRLTSEPWTAYVSTKRIMRAVLLLAEPGHRSCKWPRTLDEWRLGFPVSWTSNRISRSVLVRLRKVLDEDADVAQHQNEKPQHIPGSFSWKKSLDSICIVFGFTEAQTPTYYYPALNSRFRTRGQTCSSSNSNKRRNDWVIHASITPQGFIKFSRERRTLPPSTFRGEQRIIEDNHINNKSLLPSTMLRSKYLPRWKRER